MDWSGLTDFLSQFETEKVLTFLDEMNVSELIYNPWFLGSMGVLALLALLMRWRLLLSSILLVTGLAGLISYTLEQGTSLQGGLNNQTLLVFVASGAGLIGLVIYLLFIKSD